MGKHDYVAVRGRVYMVFDATIRPSGRVDLQPRPGLKQMEPGGQWAEEAQETVHGALAVVVHGVGGHVEEAVAGHL
jgi:hypothetical protein